MSIKRIPGVGLVNTAKKPRRPAASRDYGESSEEHRLIHESADDFRTRMMRKKMRRKNEANPAKPPKSASKLALRAAAPSATYADYWAFVFGRPAREIVETEYLSDYVQESGSVVLFRFVEQSEIAATDRAGFRVPPRWRQGTWPDGPRSFSVQASDELSREVRASRS